jgi:hypothetical protein
MRALSDYEGTIIEGHFRRHRCILHQVILWDFIGRLTDAASVLCLVEVDSIIGVHKCIAFIALWRCMINDDVLSLA